MRYTDADIRKMFKDLITVPIQVFPAIVKTVDEEKYIIDVVPIGRAEVFDVRLKAGIDEVLDGVVEIPEVDSEVLIGIIGNDMNTCFVVKTSKVTKVIINGGENGGLVLLEKLKENLDSLKSYVIDLKTATQNGLNAVGVSTAANGPAAAASFSGEMAGKSIDFEDMENTVVTQ